MTNGMAISACACLQEELDKLTDLFAEEISSIELQQLIFSTHGQFQLSSVVKKIHSNSWIFTININTIIYSDKRCPRS